jgi:hypothetical protein
MITVGNTPPLYWADNITVEPKEDGFAISGMRSLHPEDGAPRGSDIVAGYAKAIAEGARFKGGANDAPHVKLLRADSDEKLLAFIQTYGPVAPVAASVRLGPVKSCSARKITAFEALERLRRERDTFAAAIELFDQIRRKTPTFNRIVELAEEVFRGTLNWKTQWDEEESRRDKLGLKVTGPSWVWNGGSYSQMSRAYFDLAEKVWGRRSGNPDVDGSGEYDYLIADCGSPVDGDPMQIVEPSHAILCAILNGFPVHIRRWQGRSVELPHEDLTFGIRPVLYHLLRCDYLSEVHIALCPRADCEQKWFIQSRQGQMFCTEKCERKKRQREYYIRRGREKKRDYYREKRKRADSSKASLSASQ